jgi:hypothetical protein
MVFTMLESEKLKHYSRGVCDPANVDEAIEHMVQFAAAGLRAPALLPPDDPADEQKTALPMEGEEVTV